SNKQRIEPRSPTRQKPQSTARQGGTRASAPAFARLWTTASPGRRKFWQDGARGRPSPIVAMGLFPSDQAGSQVRQGYQSSHAIIRRLEDNSRHHGQYAAGGGQNSCRSSAATG